VCLAKGNNYRLQALHSVEYLILGTRGRTTLKCILLGSTVERLLKGIPCSVPVVRPPVAAGQNAIAGNAGQ
jgi:hypothetical protein